ncbi:glycine cleavage system protein GcvH [Bartonella sp. DGB1]|uniref:glycine cleavage system protein GcvH n=1 Tax=Bartonella sp. DGB1 TaxID=3239807 RepID=UPI003523F5C9
MTKTYYTEDHEWVTIDGDIATVGITDYAQNQLGDLVFVELPEVAQKIKKGETTVVVESVKAASDVYSPLSGEIIQINDNLENDASLVNQSAENEGWLWKMRFSSKDELDNLLSLEDYKKLI